MYSIPTLTAISTAREALASVSEYFGRAAQSSNGTSTVARIEARLRLQALEALEGLASIGDDLGDDGPMPRSIAATTMTPLVELLGLVDEPAPPAAWETPVDVLALSLPALSGGAPFEPSEEDWDDFAAWCDSVDRERDVDAIHRDMYGY